METNNSAEDLQAEHSNNSPKSQVESVEEAHGRAISIELICGGQIAGLKRKIALAKRLNDEEKSMSLTVDLQNLLLTTEGEIHEKNRKGLLSRIYEAVGVLSDDQVIELGQEVSIHDIAVVTGEPFRMLPRSESVYFVPILQVGSGKWIMAMENIGKPGYPTRLVVGSLPSQPDTL